MSRKKRAVARQKPQDIKKIPRGASKAESYGQMPFAWRTSRIDCEGPFGWGCVDHRKLFGYIIPKFHEFETMSWHQLMDAKKKHHSCEVNGMEKAARDRLTELGMEDQDTLFCLSLSSKERVWGVKDRYILQLIWFDPEHKVYKSLKTHT